MDWMPQAIRDGILVVLIVSGPLILAAALIGLVIGILQAATQVQEQTIGTAVKLIGVFGLMLVSGFWMFQYLNQYTSKTLSSAFTFVPRRSQKVIPRDSAVSKNDNFSQRINSERFTEPIMVIEPEKIESKLPEGGGPPGHSIYAGAPHAPEVPVVKEVLPDLPKLPKSQVKEVIPNDFQELKPIGDSSPVMDIEMPVIENNNLKQNNDLENNKLNIAPQKPINKISLESNEDSNDDDRFVEKNYSWLN